MANINVSELSVVGSNLFSDSESFMAELTDQEFNTITGGLVASDQPLPSSYLTPVVSVGALFKSPILAINQISQVAQSINQVGIF